MGKYRFLIFLLCFKVGIAFAGTVQTLDPVIEVEEAPTCGSLTFVGNPGDTETFEYQEGDFCTTEFSETDPATSIISTYDNTQVKNGSYACSFAHDGTGNDGHFIQVDLGAGDSDFSYDFWFWPHDYDDYAGYTFHCPSASADMSNKGFVLYHYHFGDGQCKFEAVGGSSDTSSAYSSEAWYRFEVDFNQNDTCTIEIYNAADEYQETLTFTSWDNQPRYINWGQTVNDSDAQGTNYFDDPRYKSGGGGF